VTQFCTVGEVKQRWSGDQPTLSNARDQDILDEIVDITDSIEQEIRASRGEGEGWSFLAASDYGTQVVSVAGSSVTGTFTLTFNATTSAAISVSANAATVQTQTDAICGGGNTVVTGPPGGPWTIVYAGTLTGAQPAFTAAWSLVPSTAQILVEQTITGSASSVTRRYTGKSCRLLLIDDAISVSAVSLIQSNGTLIRTLVAGTDYLVAPLNSLPITGLTAVGMDWPRTPGGVLVTMRPGYALAVPGKLHECSIQEVIRGIRGGQAGVDDRLGTQPYASQTVTRAWLASTYRVINQYRFGAGMLRDSF